MKAKIFQKLYLGALLEPVASCGLLWPAAACFDVLWQGVARFGQSSPAPPRALRKQRIGREKIRLLPKFVSRHKFLIFGRFLRSYAKQMFQ